MNFSRPSEGLTDLVDRMVTRRQLLDRLFGAVNRYWWVALWILVILAALR